MKTSKALFALLAVSFLFACGDDKEGDNNIQAVDPGVILVDPAEVVFARVDLLKTDVQTLVISNNGSGTLIITDIKLVEETLEDGGGREISEGTNWKRSARLEQDEVIELDLKYTPRDTSVDSGYIEIVSNDPENGNLRVPIRSGDLAPRVFSRPQISFGRVPPVTDATRDMAFQLTEISNVGQSPLTISRIEISPKSSDFRIVYPTDDEIANDKTNPGFPRVLGPTEILPARIFFNPTTPAGSEAELFIYSDDPESPTYKVDLIGNSGEPCIEVITGEDEINFGEGGIGFANNKRITIRNCSTGELELSDVKVCTDDNAGTCTTDAIFKVKEGSLPTLPDIISGGETRSFVVVYTPVDETVSTGILTILSDDPSKSKLEIPMTAKGTDNQCPNAIAEAKLTESDRYQTVVNTIPLKSVQFRGSNSTDVDGSIARYVWTIVSQPANSTARLEPSSEIQDPTLFLDLAGDYVVELVAYDDQGTASCGDQALVTIRATPDEDIHIQLVWNTPADQDQTDSEGTDMDLHLLHPNGTWNNEPWDIFYENRTGEWGTPGASDDPSLDADDTNGAGPENINLNNPEAGVSYSVGVYYFNAYAFGVSYATVRIFIQGRQRFEKKDVFLAETGTFWKVANIEWPSARIFAVDQQFDDFP